MNSRLTRALLLATAGAMGAAALHAQGRGGPEWTTSGFDAQRTGWIRTDPRISPDTVQKPSAFGAFKFLWKVKLQHDPGAATSLTEPILLDRLIGFRGFKSIAFIATASETVHAIDTDFGTPLWKYHINYSASPPPVTGLSADCPGGLTASMSRPTAISPSATTGGGFGGPGGGRSGGGVGEPGKGATTLAMAGQARGGGPQAPPGSAPAGSGAVPGSAAAAAGALPGGLPPGGGGGGVSLPFVPGAEAAYTVGSDGYLHALNVSNGWDNMTPALFLPANTRATGLIIATATDGGAVAYATTTNGCGSQPDAVWAMDLGSPQKGVSAFKAGGATIVATTGLAFGRDGTVYVLTSDGAVPLSSSLIALEPRTLKLKASIRVPNAYFRSSALVFRLRDRDAVAAADGRTVFLFDSASLENGPIARASFESASHEAGALASWLDTQNTPWIAVTSSRGVATFKVIEEAGVVALRPGWVSRAIAAPLRPLVINGVLFVASSGTRTAPAVLYAFDAATGRDLWNSGKTMTSTASGGLSAGGGRVYVPAADGTLYAFGFEIEK